MAAIGLIYNPRAGAGATGDELVTLCHDHGLAVEAYPLSGQMKAEFFDQRGWTTVIAAGGDGTIRAVAGELVGSDRKLGIIPAGTLNHFAKDLAVSTRVSEAITVIAAGHSVKVDTASVNDHVFINNSSLGLYPHLVRHRDSLASKMGKWPAAVFGLAKSLIQRRTYRLQMSIDGKTSQFVTPFVFIGNNNYGIDELGISNRHNLTGGELCMYLVKSTSLTELANVSFKALLGNADQESGLQSYTARSIIIASPRPKLAVALDGEALSLATPLNYNIKPASLHVIVPR